MTRWRRACFRRVSPNFSSLPQIIKFNTSLTHCLLSLPADVQGEWTDGGMKDGLANVNETVSFNYKISNIGSTSLLDFCLTDANLGNGCLECMSPGTGIVAPRDSFTCHFIHQVR